MQRAAVDIDADPSARLERRAAQGIRQRRGIASDAHGRKVILQALRTAQQERPIQAALARLSIPTTPSNDKTPNPPTSGTNGLVVGWVTWRRGFVAGGARC